MQKEIDKELSYVEWKGYQGDKSHTGRLRFARGTLTFEGKKPVGGTLELDMDSLAIDKMEDQPKDREDLRKHLRSPDFFEIDRYPVAEFEIEEVMPTASAKKYSIIGELKVKDQTITISTMANIKVTAHGTVSADAKLKLDKNDLNIAYEDIDDILTIKIHLEA